MSSAEKDACVRFRRGGQAGHVESIFAKLNLGDARALWLKVTFLRDSRHPRREIVEAWAIAFNLGRDSSDRRVALKQTWPASEANFETRAFYIQIANVEWRHGRLVGELSGPGQNTLSWDLTFEPRAQGFRHIPYDWMYRGSVPKSKATSPQVDIRYSGRISVNGHVSDVDNAPGMLGHNWGLQHAESWTWVHCNAWKDAKNVVFEGVTSKVRFGPFPMPLLTVLHVGVEEESFDLNGIGTALRTQSFPRGLSWQFQAEARGLQLSGAFRAHVDSFVGLTYVDPSGDAINCLNSKIADGTLRIRRRLRGRWLDWKTLEAVQTVALEIGDRERTHGVEIVIP